MDKDNNQKNVKMQSFRASDEDFAKFRALAKESGMSQGEVLSELIACWNLNHVSEDLSEQAGNVKAIQALLTQLSNIYLSQFDALKALKDNQAQTVSMQTVELQHKIDEMSADYAALRQRALDKEDQLSASVAKWKQAHANEKKRADEAIEDANKAKKEADDITKKANATLEAVQSLKDALKDEKHLRASLSVQRDDLAKRSSALTQKLQDADKKLNDAQDKNKDMSRQLESVQAELQNVRDNLTDSKETVKELKDELGSTKADLKSAQADLRDLTKEMNSRIDKEKADAVTAAEPRIRAEYEEKYAAWVKNFKQQISKK